MISLVGYITNSYSRFTTCLDASKTGLRVKLTAFNQDKQQCGTKKPWYVWKLENAKGGKGNSSKNGVLQRKSKEFVLDALVEEGEKLKEETLQKYRLKAQEIQTGEDEDLSKPWNAAKAKAAQARAQNISGFSDNLEDIRAHVEKAQREFQRAVARGSNVQGSKDNHFDKVASGFAKPPTFRGFVFFSDEDVQILKASLASTMSLRFAFSVAFRDLCAIKARAAGNVAITHQFAQCITIPNKVARMLSQALTGDTSLGA